MPIFTVPFCTKIVATGPKPLSNLESITTPLDKISELAFKSRTSDSRRIASIKPSIPSPDLAEV